PGRALRPDGGGRDGRAPAARVRRPRRGGRHRPARTRGAHLRRSARGVGSGRQRARGRARGRRRSARPRRRPGRRRCGRRHVGGDHGVRLPRERAASLAPRRPPVDAARRRRDRLRLPLPRPGRGADGDPGGRTRGGGARAHRRGRARPRAAAERARRTRRAQHPDRAPDSAMTRGSTALPAALATLAVSAALGAAVAELARLEVVLAEQRRAASVALAACDACAAEVVAALPVGWDFTPLLAGPDGRTGSAGAAPGPADPPRALLRLEARAGGGRRALEALVGRDRAPGIPALLWLGAAPGTDVSGTVRLDGADADGASASDSAGLGAPDD